VRTNPRPFGLSRATKLKSLLSLHASSGFHTGTDVANLGKTSIHVKRCFNLSISRLLTATDLLPLFLFLHIQGKSQLGSYD
jgi:hypothetical protein